LHATTKTKDEVKGALLLNVVVGKSATIFELLSSEDQTLLIRRYSFLVLNLEGEKKSWYNRKYLLLDVVYGISWLDFEGNRLTGQSLDEDLHATSKTKDEVKGALLLNVVVGEGATVFELLAGEDESLLIGRDALLILDLNTVRNKWCALKIPFA
jgi:streptomycin 6-kinase